MKRIFDISFSLITLIVFSIPLIIIGFAIIFFYNHPIFFLQDRIGKSKKTFKIYKFQTLIDNKATKLGAILRKTGLDELPQFVNVFKGDMSIVAQEL